MVAPWDQHAWHASLGRQLSPIYHVIMSSSPLCTCKRLDSADAITAIYRPLVHVEPLLDHAQVCDEHPFDYERGKHALWQGNSAYYETPELIQQQRAWFAWRVGMRQRIENLYALKRGRSGLSPEAAYAAAIGDDLHPALEEQVPLGRLEDEYQRRTVVAITDGLAPWDHPIRDDFPGVREPAMPGKQMAPPEVEVSARDRVTGWVRLEIHKRDVVVDLVKTQNPDMPAEELTIDPEGRGDRTLHIDTHGGLVSNMRDRVRGLLAVQFGAQAPLIEG